MDDISLLSQFEFLHKNPFVIKVWNDGLYNDLLYINEILCSPDDFYAYLDYYSYKNIIFINHSTHSLSIMSGMENDKSLSDQFVSVLYPNGTCEYFINKEQTPNYIWDEDTEARLFINIAPTGTVLTFGDLSHWHYDKSIKIPNTSSTESESALEITKFTDTKFTDTYNDSGVMFSNINYSTTGNPIKDYMKVKKLKENIKIDDVQAPNRTLAIVYGDNTADADYIERVQRFVASLNTPETIKVVVITITGDEIYQGLTFDNPPSDKEIDKDRLDKIKSKFVQVVEVRRGGA